MDLSLRELEILRDREFLKTKSQVSLKIIQLLGDVEHSLKEYLASSSFAFPPDALDTIGKISRGEKYHGLPYMVLDFPRKFTADSVFAFRTIFLWGEGFSSALHLAGSDLDTFRPALLSLPAKFRNNDIWISSGEDQWEHHFGPSNYRPVDELDDTQLVSLLGDKPFLKVARRLDIDQWKRLVSHSTFTFDLFLKCLEQ